MHGKPQTRKGSKDVLRLEGEEKTKKQDIIRYLLKENASLKQQSHRQ